MILEGRGRILGEWESRCSGEGTPGLGGGGV